VEIEITALDDENIELMSASRAELGENAATITWGNCMRIAERIPLVTDENRDEIVSHFRGYGAWTQEELDGMSDKELSAMVWQEAAAALRQVEDQDCVEGDRIYRDESGKLWLYLGM